MAKDKKSFIAYVNWKSTFDALPNDKAGQLIKHIFSYVNDEDPITEDILINAVFANIKDTLNRDLDKYKNQVDTNRTNGAKGGRPKKTEQKQNNPMGLLETEQKRKKHDSDNDNDNVTVNENIINYKEVVDHFHFYCDKLSKIKKLSDERKKHINARFKEFDLETIIKVFKKAGESKFLCGDNDRKWKSDFDWIFNPTNFLKILEGKYENKEDEKNIGDNTGQKPDFKTVDIYAKPNLET